MLKRNRSPFGGDGVLFVERANELAVCGKVNPVIGGSRSESESSPANQSHALDPKPGELSMSRLNLE